MLRAALIGFGQTGKTALFQPMTSARGDEGRPFRSFDADTINLRHAT
jgi:hypothetical protein